MGPSGSGKSTLLKTLNRIIELYKGVRVEGKVTLNGEDIFSMDPVTLRRRVGMVFQQPTPFPHMSIYDNIAYPLRANGIVKDKAELNEEVKYVLEKVHLWDEVKDRLRMPAGKLSGGQQQRLVIARALALKPEVLLMDEPTSMIDVVNARKIEELITELSRNITIIIVTHNPQQAARISNYVAFLYNADGSPPLRGEGSAPGASLIFRHPSLGRHHYSGPAVSFRGGWGSLPVRLAPTQLQ